MAWGLAGNSDIGRHNETTMSQTYDRYENPLIARYASSAMAELWGDQRKFSTWRRLWVALAEAEADLGIDVR